MSIADDRLFERNAGVWHVGQKQERDSGEIRDGGRARPEYNFMMRMYPGPVRIWANDDLAFQAPQKPGEFLSNRLNEPGNRPKSPIRRRLVPKSKPVLFHAEGLAEHPIFPQTDSWNTLARRSRPQCFNDMLRPAENGQMVQWLGERAYPNQVRRSNCGVIVMYRNQECAKSGLVHGGVLGQVSNCAFPQVDAVHSSMTLADAPRCDVLLDPPKVACASTASSRRPGTPLKEPDSTKVVRQANRQFELQETWARCHGV